MNLILKNNLLKIESNPKEPISNIKIVDFKGKLIQFQKCENEGECVDLDFFQSMPNIFFVTIQTNSGKYYTEVINYL